MAVTGPRFGGQADAYRRLRPGYPGSVFERLTEACGEQRALAIDLGAGSGQATGRLLDLFERVIAVEPDADMAARIPPHARLEVRVQPAEEAVFAEPPDAIVAATSFHWMDAPRVCALAARSLRPGGVFMPFGYGPFPVQGPPAAGAVAAAEYELWRPYTDERLLRWRPYGETIEETGLARSVERFEESTEQAFAPQDAAGLMLTTSYAAAFARTRGPGYAEDFTRRLVEAAAGQPVTIRFDLMGAVARF